MTKNYPPPIISTEPGTWAYSTVSMRLPAIAGKVIDENQFPDEINQGLSILQEEINSGAIRHLRDQAAPDRSAWENYVQPYLGQSWLEVPWFFTEHYFYRRIIEAVDYFRLGKDPFGHQKQQGLETSQEDIRSLAAFLQGSLAQQDDIEEALRKGLYFSLWGNQADLSLWPAGSAANPRHGSQQSLQDHLLANDIERVLPLLAGSGPPRSRLDVMLDNAGFELVSDLALADILLGLGLVKEVILHAKEHPTFVSDVIPEDVGKAIRFLSLQQDPGSREFGERLDGYVHEGRLQTRSHFFWNSPLPMWELPVDLRGDWTGSSLVISKGDANYRRLLGDLMWDYSLPFDRVVDYLPAPMLALRTLKAELAAGLEPERIEWVEAQDPDWLVDGRWGVIHLAPGTDGGE